MVHTMSIIVSGKVQGVFFRQRTQEIAIELGLTGEVRNHTDGTVHIQATGTTGQLERLINWCKKGPTLAVVTSVVSAPVDLCHFTGFNVLR